MEQVYGTLFQIFQQALQSDIDLQKYFINYLCTVNRHDDAVRWVVHCNMFDDAPYSVRPFLDQKSLQKAQSSLDK